MGMDEMFGWKGKVSPRRMPETTAAWDGGVMSTRGLLAGTQVATGMGWRAVEALAAGDMVLTFDAGLQPLVEVRRDVFWAADTTVPRAYASVHVPAGALGNAQDIELLPDHGVLIESDAACDAYGDPFAVIPAKALEGFRGITRIAPRTQIEVITLIFACDQVIYADGGALLHCPRAYVPLDELGAQRIGYDVIPARDAAFLVECMKVEDQNGIAA
jgi:Hint domain-containing protein